MPHASWETTLTTRPPPPPNKKKRKRGKEELKPISFPSKFQMSYIDPKTLNLPKTSLNTTRTLKKTP